MAQGWLAKVTEGPNAQTGAPPLRVLTLDGGGAKGFYTLGVLKEIEAMIGCPLHQKFDLVFGTSTGAIIASLIALGHSVDNILQLHRKHVSPAKEIATDAIDLSDAEVGAFVEAIKFAACVPKALLFRMICARNFEISTPPAQAPSP